MFIIFGLHVIHVWVMSTLILLKVPSLCPAHLSKSLACVISIPQALILLTAYGIIIISIGKYIEVIFHLMTLPLFILVQVILEIVLRFDLVNFLSSTVCGGKGNLVLYTAD